MAHHFRSATVLPEKTGSILSTHMAAKKPSLTPVPEDLMPSFGLHEHCIHARGIQAHRQNVHKHKTKQKESKYLKTLKLLFDD